MFSLAPLSGKVVYQGSIASSAIELFMVGMMDTTYLPIIKK